MNPTPADASVTEQPTTPTDAPYLAFGQWQNDPLVAPFLQQVEKHATGRGYPINEIELQELLNQDALNPSFSLKGIAGLTAKAASIIISSEIDTNFYNALAHVREAQGLFPSDPAFHGSEVDVMRRMRATSMEGQSKDRELKKQFFGAKKSDKKANKSDTATATATTDPSATVTATPREEKEKEKKDKKEKKKAEKEEKKKDKKEKKKKKEKDETKGEKKPGLIKKLLHRGSSGNHLNAEGATLHGDAAGSDSGSSAREVESAREIESARVGESEMLSGRAGESARSDHSNP